MHIGTKIKNYRKLNNVSQIDLAKNLGVTKGMLSHLENDRREASISIIHKLMKVTNTNYEYWDDSFNAEEEYIKSRVNMFKTSELLDMLIEKNLINNIDQIENDVFHQALFSALKADLQHKIDIKKFEK